MNKLSIIKTHVEDRKFKGFILQSEDGETKYLDVKEYKTLLENTGSKILVRLPNEDYFDYVKIDLEKFEVSNEFPHEIFGWYDGVAISIKK